MQVSVEAGDGLERRMTVDLPAEKVEAEVEKRLQRMARTARLAGFRPGKVPVKVLRQRYLDQLQREILAELVSTTFPEALSKEQLSVAGSPYIEPEINRSAGRYGYRARFEVLPTIQLADLSDKTVKRPQVEITDADVAAVIERLRVQRKTWRPTERPAQQGDVMNVDFQGRIEGEVFDGGEGTDVAVELGSGRMMPGFEDGLVGASSGDERTLRLRFSDDHRSESLRGRPVEFLVTVREVREPVLPEVDGELARSFGIEDGDLDRFRQDVRANMERELRQRVAARVKGQVMDILLAAHPIPVPRSLVQNEVRSLKQQSTEGRPDAAALQLPDQLFADSARRRVALGLIVGAVVKQQGLQVDPARVREMVEEMAASYESPQEVITYYYADRKRLAPLESLALEEQVVDWALRLVKVEEDPMSFEQLHASVGAAEPAPL